MARAGSQWPSAGAAADGERPMKVTSRGRYAVMAMADIARHGHGAPVPISDVGTRQSISVPFLEQIFNQLRRAGMVASVRGPGGGYRLVLDPHEIRISDIMFAVEEQMRTTRCEGRPGIGCGCTEACLTHGLWEALGAHIASFLSSVTLGHVVEGNSLAFVAPGPGCRDLIGSVLPPDIAEPAGGEARA
jgi:Rrf2 family protein